MYKVAVAGIPKSLRFKVGGSGIVEIYSPCPPAIVDVVCRLVGSIANHLGASRHYCLFKSTLLHSTLLLDNKALTLNVILKLNLKDKKNSLRTLFLSLFLVERFVSFVTPAQLEFVFVLNF